MREIRCRIRVIGSSPGRQSALIPVALQQVPGLLHTPGRLNLPSSKRLKKSCSYILL